MDEELKTLGGIVGGLLAAAVIIAGVYLAVSTVQHRRETERMEQFHRLYPDKAYPARYNDPCPFCGSKGEMR